VSYLEKEAEKESKRKKKSKNDTAGNETEVTDGEE